MKQMNLKNIRSIQKTRTVVSLFSGFGSTTIGYNLSGFKVLVSVNPYSEVNRIYQKNFKEVTSICCNLEDVSTGDILFRSGLEKYELDILDVSLPFNFASKTKDIPAYKRTDSNIQEVARLLKGIMPKVFVVNIDKKFSIGKSRLLLNEFVEMLKEIGYKVDTEILNARYYEVPEDKEILFIVGVREDLKVKPVFPEALERVVKTKEVLQDLLHIPMDFKTNPVRAEYATKFFKAGCTEEEIDDLIETHHMRVQKSNYKRGRWEEPYYTLNRNFTRPIHPKLDRVLSVWEAMRIQTYPDDFALSTNPSLNWQQICGSVPPNLIKHLAKSIREEILERLN